MARLTNKVTLRNGCAEVVAETANYKHTILIDVEELPTVGTMRVSNRGYAYRCGDGKSVASVIMGCDTNYTHVVDHINGNSLDNRKQNLRLASQQTNCRNRRQFIRNNTGVVGIAYRENGNYQYYRVSATDLKGHRLTKQFCINKLGKRKAFRRATDYLDKVKAENGYTLGMVQRLPGNGVPEKRSLREMGGIS